MSLKVWDQLEQGSDEWCEVRRGIVTASVVGRLVSATAPTGIDYPCSACDAEAKSPCRSKVKRDGEHGTIKTLHPERVQTALASADTAPPIIAPARGEEARGLTAVLTAERISGNTDPTWTNWDMVRGHIEEPIARAAYEDHTGTPVDVVGFMVRDDWGFQIGYSPDGLVGDDGLIEVKSRRQKKHLQTVLAGGVPPENMAQIQCGLMVSGRKWCDYISYCGGMHLYPVRVLPDPLWFDAIRLAVAEFETNAAEMVAAYIKATEGLPLTERTPDFEEVELKL